MTRNPLAAQAVATLRAAEACGFKPKHMRATDEGIVLQKPGKPVLILTHENARLWAQEIEEAEHG